MSRSRSQCSTCVLFRSPFDREDGDFSGGPYCAAWPGRDGIPDAVLNNQLDHRQPIDGDRGIRWKGKPDTVFPESAFPESALGRGGAVPPDVLPVGARA